VYLRESDIELIKAFLIEKLSPYLIVLFGSAAKGCMKSTSDVDIAFLTDKDVQSFRLFEIAQELAGMLKREVDLIDLKSVSTVFQAQIVGNGKVIYDADPERRRSFFMIVLKQYAKLNEEREPVLERIRERGAIYG